MLISKGTDVNAAWIGSIAVSKSGSLWKNISAANITVVPQVTSDRNQKQKYKMILMDGLDELEWFFLDEVDNQPTWTNDMSGLTQSVLDITTWVGASIGGGDAAILTSILNELVSINGKGATETTLERVLLESVKNATFNKAVYTQLEEIKNLLKLILS